MYCNWNRNLQYNAVTTVLTRGAQYRAVRIKLITSTYVLSICTIVFRRGHGARKPINFGIIQRQQIGWNRERSTSSSDLRAKEWQQTATSTLTACYLYVPRKQARLSHRSAQSRLLPFIDLLHQFFFWCLSVQNRFLNLSEGQLVPVFVCITETICQSTDEWSALQAVTSWTEVLKFKFCGFVTKALLLELQNVVEYTLITDFLIISCYYYFLFLS